MLLLTLNVNKAEALCKAILGFSDGIGLLCPDPERRNLLQQSNDDSEFDSRYYSCASTITVNFPPQVGSRASPFGDIPYHE